MESVPDYRDSVSASSNPSAVTEAPAALAQNRDARPRKKTSTACSVCKKRKTKCSGEYPCDRCIQRGTVADCVIDTNADLRRRGASDRRTEEIETDRRLLDGLLRTIRSGTEDQLQSLFSLIRGDDASRSDLLVHVDGLYQVQNLGSEGSAAESEHPSSPRSGKQREIQDAQHRSRGNKIHDLLNHEPEGR